MTQSEREVEALLKVIEEAAEVQKAAVKALLWGYDSRYPEDGPNNLIKLIDELGDMSAATTLFEEVHSIETGVEIYPAIQLRRGAKLRDYAVGKFMKYSFSSGHWMHYAG